MKKLIRAIRNMFRDPYDMLIDGIVEEMKRTLIKRS